MEKLKSMVPKTLERRISESFTDDLPATCSSLLDFFINQPIFHQIVGDLTDPEVALCRKNKEAAVELKNIGNEHYSRGDYSQAVSFYSKALRVAPADAIDKDKNLLAVIYVNRASALHKKGLLAGSLRDCDRALLICPAYAKAWYRRGKANASLEKNEDATRDLDISMHFELSSRGRRQIKDEWKLISVQQMKSSSTNKPIGRSLDESHQKKLQCVSTPTKGRGMASLDDIPEASLVLSEDPYAAIILKPCRETHCHFCLSDLPMDTVPCFSCSIPLYCSQQCQELAGGIILENNTINTDILKPLSDEVQTHFNNITYPKNVVSDAQQFFEHRHECNGVHWPKVLPTEIVLAGRILIRTVELQRHCSPNSGLTEIKELSHNYEQLLPERKLELHISSIILLYCLPQSYRLDFPKNGETISKFVVLLTQIKVNSMAIVRMKFPDTCDEVLTSSVEQIKVGQAVYSAGSLFNHSCQPNIHAYFLSRTLFLRSTDHVRAGCPLELSYGPQVGELDCKKRQEILEERYSFKCGCKGCSEINFPDLVLNAFRCTKPNCCGVVLDYYETQCEKQKIIHSSFPLQQLDTMEYGEICKVASQVLRQSSSSYLVEPGKCFNCGSYRDLEDGHLIASKADIVVKCLQHQTVINAVHMKTISEALVSLDQLRSTLHAYNKKIAELEDHLAHAFCLVGKLQLAVKHCEASLQILEKLYGCDHIATGNELLKLSSIQLELGDQSALDSVNRVVVIFSRYYGSDMDQIFPCLQGLKKEAHQVTRRKNKNVTRT